MKKYAYIKSNSPMLRQAQHEFHSGSIEVFTLSLSKGHQNWLMKSSKLLLCTLALFITNIPAQGPIGTRVVSYDVALQNDGKAVVGGYATVCDQDQFLLARYGTNGALDGSLNGVGYATTQFGGSAAANAIMVQPADQKIVTAGYSDDTVGVIRYTTSGGLDATFGSGGRASIDIGVSEVATALLNQSGKILVAGGATVGGGSQFLLARLTTAGALDTTFGPSNQGYVTTLIGAGANANGVVEQTNGRLVLAGVAIVNGVGNFALARYTSSGTLDTTFGTNGITTTLIDNFCAGNACAIDSSNRIIVVGYSRTTATRLALARYTSTGSLDTTFGTNGIVNLEFAGVETVGNGVAIQSDGKIVICGTSGNNVLVARFTTSGVLDTTFNTTGYVLTSLGVPANGNAITVQPSDQKILVAGTADLSALIIRYNTNGSLDSTYGNGGITQQPEGSSELVCGVNTSLNAFGYLYNNNFNIMLSPMSPTPIPFPNEPILKNISHDEILTPADITFLLDGTYLAHAIISLSAIVEGVTLELQLNGTPIAGAAVSATSLGTYVLQAQFEAFANDVLKVVETGLVTGTISGNASITIEKIG